MNLPPSLPPRQLTCWTVLSLLLLAFTIRSFVHPPSAAAENAGWQPPPARPNRQPIRNAEDREARIRQATIRIWKRKITPLVDRELSRMQQLARLTDSQIDKLKVAIQQDVDAMAIGLANRQQRLGSNPSRFVELPGPIHSKLAEQAESLIGQAALAPYSEDAKVRRELFANSSRLGLLIILDRVLVLSSEQQEAVEGILREAWNPAWNGLVKFIAMTNSGATEVPRDLPTERLRAVLRPAQLASLEAAQQRDFQTMSWVNEERNRERRKKEWIEETRKECNRVVQLKIGDIEQLCGIDAEQREKLEIAGNGAANSFMTRKLAAMEKVQQYWADDRARLSTDVETMRAAYANPSTELLREAPWKVGSKLLTDEQFARYEAREADRASTVHRVMMYVVVADLDERLRRDLRPTGRQEVDLFEMLVDQTHPADSEVLGIGAMTQVLNIAGAKFQAILDEAQWKLLDEHFDEMRKRLAAIEKPS